LCNWVYLRLFGCIPACCCGDAPEQRRVGPTGSPSRAGASARRGVTALHTNAWRCQVPSPCACCVRCKLVANKGGPHEAKRASDPGNRTQCNLVRGPRSAPKQAGSATVNSAIPLPIRYTLCAIRYTPRLLD
jgi:hypothetical protein